MKAVAPTPLIWSLAGAVMLFLYLPILVIVALSFNTSPRVGLPFEGFTFDWYAALLDNRQMMKAIWNSVYVAAGTVLIGVPLGVMGAIAMDRFHFPGKETFRRLVLLPVVLPGVITGVSLLNFYVWGGVRLSLHTIIMGQGTALICITVTEVFARLQQLGRSQYEAAHDLGANEWEIFFRVTLPNIKTALIGSVMIVLSLSLDEIAVTYLLTGRDNTLPMVLWSILRREATPLVNVAGTVMIVLTLVLVTIGLRLSRGRQHNAH
ncbi:ABC transporter permease [Zavarzinia compransoris]|uniref:ABC transporter permease n=1 Tax=Zavarzinia compransoris TaxID=1264899 RepID=A0A317E3E3_9PROT|nr:ABC transporter permease [Zavarzinia compransoris]PWR21618.1 ABC transporter permease [Zavarzinia compransoris]TDP45602.1 spermidine/putrescine transport system permease protein [Zavarzinia compransoris]